MQDRIAGFVADNSDMTKERYIELCMKTDELVLDIGSVLDGKSAVDEGLVNELGSLSKSISALYDMIEEMNTPNQA